MAAHFIELFALDEFILYSAKAWFNKVALLLARASRILDDFAI